MKLTRICKGHYAVTINGTLFTIKHHLFWDVYEDGICISLHHTLSEARTFISDYSKEV